MQYIARRTISVKEFKEISKKEEVQIVGFTSMRRTKNNQTTNSFHHTNGTNYILKKDMPGATYKYIDVGMRNYIAVKRPGLVYLSLILLVVGTVGTCATLQYKGYIPKIDGTDIDLSNPPTINGQEGIALYGFDDEYILTEQSQLIKLINPKNNTVYFKYSVYCGDKLLIQTGDILPNKMKEINLWSLLPAGKHNIVIHLDTVDIVTGEETTSVDFPTNIEIMK